MKQLILAIIIVCTLSQAQAQDSLKKFKERVYKATLVGDNKIIAQEYLASITDSTFIVSQFPMPFHSTFTNTNGSKEIHYNKVDYIRVKRKGSAGKGALIGLAAGTLGGVILGITLGSNSSTDESSQWGYALSFSSGEMVGIGALIGGLGGTLIGAIIGSVSSKKFHINKNRDRLKQLNTTLLERVYSN